MEDQHGASNADAERPSAARVYDYLLGGHHNFAADRELARQLQQAAPELRRIIWATRAFSHRAVRFLTGVGVRQFIDLGAGLPTAGSVHEVARRHAPGTRVVYVENDPVAVAHGEQVLAGDPAAAVIAADLRDYGTVLSHPRARALIDPREPVGVLLVGVLHELPADEPARAIAGYRREMAAGSFLALSQATWAGTPEDAEIKEAFDKGFAPSIEMAFRTRAEVSALFEGFDLVDPGVVHIAQWHPDPAPPEEPTMRPPVYAGVGRLPARPLGS
ncbi:SAM-dependent methyltransferase [Phytohabitans rumicis]|uniref:S-adenosyl methyltransferase n=1 Tax=Phytohabitans rumicis TaxID=1076125 RepID=A0A6V8KQ89_9ACTN|nr:SAM-dependent methyltransferase [Phytohabitans rumicis]GFJ87353.1 hypothetical protein Prum_009950 [Phytohabitans rumicis]